MKKNKHLYLLACLFLIAGMLIARGGTVIRPASDRETKLEAAALMQIWMDEIKEYKENLGLPLCPEDFFETGMLGEEYTFITTTHGALEAKRTTTNPDMAALMVQMLEEAGIRSGDTIGAGFSGSFPCMDLALLAACQVMDINCVYIASFGSSTYGANQPECTLIDMLKCLLDRNLLQKAPSLTTPGGYDDCGLDMDEELRDAVIERIHAYGFPFMMEEDFEKNIAARMDLYETEGPISCFVGVGGNLTTGGDAVSLPYGLIRPRTIQSVTEKPGLIQRYNKAGLPALHILNIKQLMADYGMDYDPETRPAAGESAIYFETVYPRFPILICLVCALFCLYRTRHQ